jgi:hypothetical protein
MDDDIRSKMLTALPHMRFAIEEALQANPNANIQIGILAKNADGTGKVVATFAASEFIEDLAALLEAGPLTDDDRADARAMKIITGIGL